MMEVRHRETWDPAQECWVNYTDCTYHSFGRLTGARFPGHISEDRATVAIVALRDRTPAQS